MMKLQPAMAEALRLTRSGNLQEATRLIQSNLSTGFAAPPRARAEVDGDVIDVTPRRVALTTHTPERAKRPSTQRPSTQHPPESRAKRTPTGSRFEERSYAGSAGQMTYWLYLPVGHTPGMPVVVMLHGCTQSPQDFARGTGMNALADEMGFIVAYPCQTQAANMQRCWNWFKPSDQKRDSGEPALIAAITRAVIDDHQADRTRVYVAGLSAGGAAAAIMGNAYPDIYAAIGIHSGLACGSADSMFSALSAMRSGSAKAQRPSATDRFVPVITFHGDSDTTVNAVNSGQIVAAAAERSAVALTTHTQGGASAGHRKYSRTLSTGPDGRVMIEQWTIHGAGHAWAGGKPEGSYTDATGPDASRAMLTFFGQHSMASSPSP